MTRMTHPDTALTVDATPANEAMYASQGWLAVADEPAPGPVADEPAKPARTTK